MADQLQPQDGPAMTATEVHVRVGLIRQLLGPIYGRLQAEYLAPLAERCFGLAYRAGIFGEAPQSLGGRNLKVKYNNPLARAQKMEDVAAIERLNGNLTRWPTSGRSRPGAAARWTSSTSTPTCARWSTAWACRSRTPRPGPARRLPPAARPHPDQPGQRRRAAGRPEDDSQTAG
jgi:hypothetical protein